MIFVSFVVKSRKPAAPCHRASVLKDYMSLPFRQRIAWVAWTIVLIASLSAVYALNRQAEGRHLVADDQGGGDTRFGFRLQESAKAMGVDSTHQAATFDARLDHIMPQVAAMGASVTVADFDRDGWQDFYVTNSVRAASTASTATTATTRSPMSHRRSVSQT